jgi:Protein of unknown function (DUF3563)
MKLIRYFFSYLMQSDEYHARKKEEVYLAESTDIHEFEYRMRELKRTKQDFPWISFKRQ